MRERRAKDGEEEEERRSAHRVRSVAWRLSAAGQPPCSHGLRGAAVADAVELAPPPDPGAPSAGATPAAGRAAMRSTRSSKAVPGIWRP